MYFALSLSDKEILSKLLEPNTESAEEDAAGMLAAFSYVGEQSGKISKISFDKTVPQSYT